jgi:exonuclease SbcC
MKPLRLKLRGAIGIFDGIGQDEIDIDFRKFESGIVALVGPNGSGKTTILENLHPYLQLASRDGSLSNHFRLRDSFRDLTFELKGNIYRSHILIDSHTSKTEAYLYKNDQALNDGKVNTYKIEIEKLLGTPELYFRSIFSCQNSESITSLTAGKRKDLFIELLGLQKFDLYAEICKTRADKIDLEASETRGRIEQISIDIGKKPALLIEISDYERDFAILKQSLTKLEDDILKAGRIIIENEKKLSDDQQRKSRLWEIGNELIDIDREAYKMLRDYETEKARVNEQIKIVHDEIDRTKKILEHKKEIEDNSIMLKLLTSQLKTFEELKDQVLEIEKGISEKRSLYDRQLREYETFLSEMNSIEANLNHERDLLNQRNKNTIMDFESRLEDAKKETSLIDEVPCSVIKHGLLADANIGSTCKLLSKANDSKSRIPQLEEKIRFYKSGEANKKDLEDLEAKREDIRKKIQSLIKPAEIDLQEFETRIRSVGYDNSRHLEVRKEYEDLEKGKWSDLLIELRNSESIIKEKAFFLADLNNQIQNFSAKHKEQYEQISGRKADREIGVADLKTSLLTPADITAMERFNQALSVTTAARKEQSDKLSSVTVDIKFRREMLKNLEESEVEKISLDNQIKEKLYRLEIYRLLQRACSRDGIPALELDAAGPEVSRIANDLLASTFGSEYQISFETTKISKDKKKQLETFEIRIYGSEGEKRIEDLSGGEKVWIETALQEAISIYLSEKSGKEYQTSFQDERDGALDPDSKQHFIDMNRESFKLGRRYYTFMISQTPEIWQQIQQRIHLVPESGSIQTIL